MTEDQDVTEDRSVTGEWNATADRNATSDRNVTSDRSAIADRNVTDDRKTRGGSVKRKPSTIKRMAVMLVFVLVLAGALAFGFFQHIQTLIASAPKPVPATVSTTTAQMATWQPQITAVGSLSAVNGVDVATQVAGIVSAIPIRSGATVQPNDELLQLNIDPDKAVLASLQAAQELSGLTLKRDTDLVSKQAISQSTLDADAADLKSKNALVAQQQALIQQKTVTAPFAGDLGIVQVSLGQYVTPGTVIVTLQDLSAMEADFLVPQGQFSSLQTGQAASITLDSLGGKAFPGTITAINPKIDSTTRNATVRATVPNPDRLLRPGMFVRVAVNAGKPEQHLTLPVTAVTYNSYGTSAYVVVPAPNGSGKVVKQVFVTTGDQRGDQVAVLKGIDAGQEVVTSGQLKLSNGAAVVIDNSVQPPNDPNAAPQEQ